MMPDSSEISSTWVVIRWTPLTTVTDTRGNSNPVAGFYIFYQVYIYIFTIAMKTAMQRLFYLANWCEESGS